jgi:hypothetical protein
MEDERKPDGCGPLRLLEPWRVHWHIENGLLWVRDVVYGEDRCRSGADRLLGCVLAYGTWLWVGSVVLG